VIFQFKTGVKLITGVLATPVAILFLAAREQPLKVEQYYFQQLFPGRQK
jgi:hypothetical protein